MVLPIELFVVPWEENGRLGQQDSPDASFIADTPTPTLELSICGDKQTNRYRRTILIFTVKCFIKVKFCFVMFY
jgi:hypothetical protein